MEKIFTKGELIKALEGYNDNDVICINIHDEVFGEDNYTFYLDPIHMGIDENKKDKGHQLWLCPIQNWICTDSSCNQYRLDLGGNKFLFKEDRIKDPVTKETYVYESTIDLSNYSQEEMFKDVESFGYSFNEMSTWIDEGKNLDLIAECIFEMEN